MEKVDDDMMFQMSDVEIILVIAKAIKNQNKRYINSLTNTRRLKTLVFKKFQYYIDDERHVNIPLMDVIIYGYKVRNQEGKSYYTWLDMEGNFIPLSVKSKKIQVIRVHWYQGGPSIGDWQHALVKSKKLTDDKIKKRVTKQIIKKYSKHIIILNQKINCCNHIINNLKFTHDR